MQTLSSRAKQAAALSVRFTSGMRLLESKSTRMSSSNSEKQMRQSLESMVADPEHRHVPNPHLGMRTALQARRPSAASLRPGT